ncbi:MAG: hypothetical protein ACOY3H_02115 [Bacillota bacterium]
MITCKCGYQHHDTSKIINKRDLHGRLRPECAICGRRIIIRSVSQREYKDLLSRNRAS